MKIKNLPSVTTTTNLIKTKFTSALGIAGQLLSRASMNHRPWRRGFVLIALALTGIALSPAARAVCQEGCLTGLNTVLGDNALLNNSGFYNTATGCDALYSNTTGSDNTATGLYALFSNTTGGDNTATGFLALEQNTTGSGNTATGGNALYNNTIGNSNTATGTSALGFNTSGGSNTAIGLEALGRNTTGSFNTANGANALFSNTTAGNNTAGGFDALYSNTTGYSQTATGANALFSNTTGIANTATGGGALFSNTMGSSNTATGVNALFSNTTGHDNIAEGFAALQNNTGSSNIALGSNAGFNLTTGSNNIDIGNKGSAGESSKIRIGTQGTQNGTFIAGIYNVAVTGSTLAVNSNGKLGVTASSARFKEAIKPMDKASEAILALKPITFRYKKEVDKAGIPQFGLVAEQVERVAPDLVVRDDTGKPFTVRYEAVNAMLLNEFLKEHRRVQEQAREIQQQKATISELKNGMETVVARLKEQDSRIQRVSAQIEIGRPTPKVVLNRP
jgi:hypothetical protein